RRARLDGRPECPPEIPEAPPGLAEIRERDAERPRAVPVRRSIPAERLELQDRGAVEADRPQSLRALVARFGPEDADRIGRELDRQGDGRRQLLPHAARGQDAIVALRTAAQHLAIEREGRALLADLVERAPGPVEAGEARAADGRRELAEGER